MRTVTLNIPNDSDYAMLLSLFKRLGIVLETTVERDVKDNGNKMVASLDKLAAIGGISSIFDPMEWQREIRSDREIR